MRILLLLLPLAIFPFFINAQLYFSDAQRNIGIYDLNECSYEFIEDIQNIPAHPYTDIALTPDGRLLGSSHDFDSIYIVEIDLINFLSVDTIVAIESPWRASSLVCSSDYIVYVGNIELFSYNLMTNEVFSLGFFAGGYQLAGDLVWFDNELYGSIIAPSGVSEDFPAKFINVNLESDGIQNSPVLTEDYTGFQGLSIVYNEELEEVELIGAYSYITDSARPTTFYNINLEDTIVTEICNSIITIASPSMGGVFGLTSADEFRTNFNLRLDLDANNSSGRFIDHFITDSLCTRVFRLSDNDVQIKSPPAGVDSMVVEIANSLFMEEDVILTLPEQSIFSISGLNTNRLVARPISSASNEEYEALIRSIRFEIIADTLIEGESKVNFYLYSDNQSSDAAMVFVRTHPEIIPYAGEDYTKELCWFSARNLLLGLGEDVYENGTWQPALYNGGHVFDTGLDAPGEYLYIAQEGDCVADSATVTVSVFPRPAINYGHIIDDAQFLYLCIGDTAYWEIDTSQLQAWEWYDGFEGIVRPITEGGVYRLWVSDNYGCDHSVVTVFREPEQDQPTIMQDTMIRCEGRVLSFYGQTVSSDTLLCEHFSSTGDCAYTFCRVFIFIPPVDYFTEESICEGETYWLGDLPLTKPGNYERLIDGGECDTLMQLQLEVYPHYERNLIVGLSPGGSYTVGDSILTEAGFYDVLLESSQGCDSLIHVEIEITNATTELQERPECKLPTLLTKGSQDLFFSSFCRCQLLTWRLFDGNGRLLKERHFDNKMLLSAQQQSELIDGLYFYQLSYQCEGVIYKDSGKIILIE